MAIGTVRRALSVFLWKKIATLKQRGCKTSQCDARLSSSDRAGNGADVLLIHLSVLCTEASQGIDGLLLRYMTERAQFQGFRYGQMKAGVSHGTSLW